MTRMLTLRAVGKNEQKRSVKFWRKIILKLTSTDF